MSKKVAFLALTYGDFQKEDAMCMFFDQERYADLFNLYIHPKESLSPHWDKYSLPNEYIIRNTKWGCFSLVSATINLLRYALNDADNDRFILISDAHLPLYNMKDVYEKIYEEQSSLCFKDFHNDSIAKHRFFKMLKLKKNRALCSPLRYDCRAFVSQWFMCDRDAAKKFVDAYDNLVDYFDTTCESYADECWFAVIANHLNLKWKDRSFCFSDWDWETEKYMIDRGCKLNPHTFGIVDNTFIDAQRKLGNIFIRKVHSSTAVDLKYLINI